MPKRKAQTIANQLTTPSKKQKIDQTFVTPVKKSTITTQIKAALSLSTQLQSDVLGRDGQKLAILNFLSCQPLSTASNSSRSVNALYISGNPGTGKSYLLSHLLETHSRHLKATMLNCNVLVNDSDIYATVFGALNGGKVTKSKNYKQAISKLAAKSTAQLLLVLDEADHLNSEDLFWFYETACSTPSSKLRLICIANTLDLASSRQLVSCHSNMHSIQFPPYSFQDLMQIGSQRVASVVEPLEQVVADHIDLKALELAAKKVAPQSGDLRMFLGLLKKAIDLACTSNSTSPPPSQSLPSTPSSGDTHLLTPPIAKVRMSHVLAAFKYLDLAASNNPITRLTDALHKISLAAELVYTSFYLAFGRLQQSNNKTTLTITQKDAFAVYESVLKVADKQEMVEAYSDFADLVDALTVQGLLITSFSTSASPTRPKSKCLKSPSAKKSANEREKTICLAEELDLVKKAFDTIINSSELGEKQAIIKGVISSDLIRQQRKLKLLQWDESAPMRGFHGDGLEGKEENMLGQERGGRNEEHDDEA